VTKPLQHVLLDKVNLQQRIKNDLDIEFLLNGLLPTAPPPFKSVVSFEESQAIRENLVPSAERIIAGQFGDWALPCDPSVNEAREMLKVKGYSLSQIVEIFSPNRYHDWTAEQREAFAAARLGLLHNEYIHISNGEIGASVFWAKHTRGTSSPSSNVGETMEILNLSFEELKELSGLDYVKHGDPGMSLFAFDHMGFNGTCSYEDAEFRDSGDAAIGLGWEAADRLVRIKRLSLRSGFELAELDEIISRITALHSSGRPELEGSTLYAIALIEQLGQDQKTTRLDILDLLEHLRSGLATKTEAAQAVALMGDLDQTSYLSYCEFVDTYPVDIGFLSGALDLSGIVQTLEHMRDHLRDFDIFIEHYEDVPELASLVDGAGQVDSNLVSEAKLKQFWEALEAEITALRSDNNSPLPSDISDLVLKTASEFMNVDSSLVKHIHAFRLHAGSNYSWMTEFTDPISETVTAGGTSALVFNRVWLKDAANPAHDNAWEIKSADGFADFFANLHWLSQFGSNTQPAPALAASLGSSITDASLTPAQKDQFLSYCLSMRIVKDWPYLTKAVASSGENLPSMLLQTSKDLTGLPDQTFTVLDDYLITNNSSNTQTTPNLLISAALRLELCENTGTTLSDLWDVVIPNKSDPRLSHWHNIVLLGEPDIAGKLREAIRDTLGRTAESDEDVVHAQNTCRQLLRNGLIASYIRETPSQFAGKSFTSEQDLVEYFLSDFADQQAIFTSVIRYSTLAVQSFIIQAMNGLISGVSVSDRFRKEAETTLNNTIFRSKVAGFSNLDNYLDPELWWDQEKSQLFREFEANIFQRELNDDNINEAYRGYIEGLESISHLNVSAIYEDLEADDPVLYLLMASEGQPRKYFLLKRYSRNEGLQEFSDFEPLTIDEPGPFVMTMIEGSIHLICPKISQTVHDDIRIEIDGDMQKAPYFSVSYMFYKIGKNGKIEKVQLEQTLDMGEYCGPGVELNLRRKLGLDKGTEAVKVPNPKFPHWKWLVKKDPEYAPLIWVNQPIERMGSNLILSSSDGQGNGYDHYYHASNSNFYFFAEQDQVSGDMLIGTARQMHETIEPHSYAYVEAFVDDGIGISACNGKSYAVPASDMFRPVNQKPAYLVPRNTQLSQQALIVGMDRPDGSSGTYVKSRYSHRDASTRILGRSPSPYSVIYEARRHRMSDMPFGYMDHKNVYLIERVKSCENSYRNTQPMPSFVTEYLYDADLDDNKKPLSNRRRKTQKKQYLVTSLKFDQGCDVARSFNLNGMDGLFDPLFASRFNLQYQDQYQNYFAPMYQPVSGKINPDHPVIEFDFRGRTPFFKNTQELFVLNNLFLARELLEDGQHAKALEALERVLFLRSDTATQSNDFWMTKWFRQVDGTTSLSAMLQAMANGSMQAQDDIAALERQIELFRTDGFNFLRLGRQAPDAFMKYAFKLYIRIIYDRGITLFKRYTMESLAEAKIWFRLCLKLLGEKPAVIDIEDAKTTLTYDQLVNPARMSAGMLDIENFVASFNFSSGCSDNPCAPSNMPVIMSDPYFCPPTDPSLTKMWEDTAEKLDFLHNSLDLNGKFREIELYPAFPDPALLSKMLGAGLSIDEILDQVSGGSALPYSSDFFINQARGLASELKSIGANLLSAYREHDSAQQIEDEEINKRNLLELSRKAAELRIREANEGVKASEYALARAKISLEEFKLRKPKNKYDIAQTKHMVRGQRYVFVEQVYQAVAGMLHGLETDVGFPAILKKIPPGKIAEALAKVPGMLASIENFKASMAGQASAAFQKAEDIRMNVRTGEVSVKEAEVQHLMAQMRVDQAVSEEERLETEIKQAQDRWDFLVFNKVTNRAFYKNLVSQNRQLLKTTYDFLFNFLKGAEASLAVELGEDVNVIEYGYLSYDHTVGDHMMRQVNALEQYKVERKSAKFETFNLTKRIMLSLLDAKALLKLRNGLPIEIEIPDWILPYYVAKDGKGAAFSLVNALIDSMSFSLLSTTGKSSSTNLHVEMVSSEVIDPKGNRRVISCPAPQQIIASKPLNDTGRHDPANDGMMNPFQHCGVICMLRIQLPENSEIASENVQDLAIDLAYRGDRADVPLETPLPDYNLSSANFAVSMRQTNKWNEIRKWVRDAGGTRNVEFLGETNSTDLGVSGLDQIILDKNDEPDYFEITDHIPYLYAWHLNQNGGIPTPVQASIALRDADGSIVYIPFVTVPGNKKATVEFSEVGTVLNGDLTVLENGVTIQYSGEVIDVVCIYQV